MKSYITLLDGVKYRVEANWNAVIAFLEASGLDDLSQMLDEHGRLKMRYMAPLLTACINEGERLEGTPKDFTSLEVGALVDINILSEFVQIYAEQTAPKDYTESKKKD